MYIGIKVILTRVYNRYNRLFKDPSFSVQSKLTKKSQRLVHDSYNIYEP